MTDSERAMLLAVSVHPDTASNLGADLWYRNGRKPQSYARPAGALLHRLSRRGLVARRESGDGIHTHWYITARGMMEAKL
jgi:hypothetical protein